MATAAWSASRSNNLNSEEEKPPRVDLDKFMTPTSLVLIFNGIPMIEPCQSRSGVNEEGMLLNVFDDDPLLVPGDSIGQTVGTRQSLGFVADTIIIQRRAEFKFIVGIKKNMGRAGILYQTHCFGDNCIEHGLDIQTGSQTQAEFFERIKFIGLLFERENQRPVFD